MQIHLRWPVDNAFGKSDELDEFWPLGHLEAISWLFFCNFLQYWYLIKSIWMDLYPAEIMPLMWLFKTWTWEHIYTMFKSIFNIYGLFPSNLPTVRYVPYFCLWWTLLIFSLKAQKWTLIILSIWLYALMYTNCSRDSHSLFINNKVRRAKGRVKTHLIK